MVDRMGTRVDRQRAREIALKTLEDAERRRMDTSDLACSVCSEYRETCSNCGMCLLCADESVKEGEGACPDCATRLLQWSNTWRLRWHDAANMQHKLLRSISKELGEAKAEIERLRAEASALIASIDAADKETGVGDRSRNEDAAIERLRRVLTH